MWIVKLDALPNGAHQNCGASSVPEGWAMIPEDFPVPDTFPFVDIEAEELTYYRDAERTRTVKKTREVESFREIVKTRKVEDVDEEGNPITKTEEYTDFEPCTVTEEYEEDELYTEQVPYIMMTVTSMTPGVIPEPVPEPEPEPTLDERNRADIDYLAVMMGVEL